MRKRLLKIGLWFFATLLSLVVLISAALYFGKDKIIQHVIGEVNTHLTAKVNVSKVDLTFWASFPNLSVDFNHVFISDSYENATNKDTLLYSDRIRLKFSPFDAWKKKYSLKELEVAKGTLQLKVDSLGRVNYSIFQKENDSTNANTVDVNLEEVTIENLRFAYVNRATSQAYRTDIQEMTLDGAFSERIFSLNAHSKLTVKEARSGKVNLIQNKTANFDVAIAINQNTGSFELTKADLKVANLPFSVEGKVSKDSIDFLIQGKQLELTEVAQNFALSQTDELTRYEGKGRVQFSLKITGEKSKTEPVSTTCSFAVKNGELTEPIKKQRIKNISLHGEYSNKGGKQNEFLTLSNISFNTNSGPFKGNLKLTKFNQPRIEGTANGKLNLAAIHALFRIQSMDTISGNLEINSDFVVQSIPQANETVFYDIQKCNGSAVFENTSFQLEKDHRVFKNINGTVRLIDDKAALDNVQVHLGNSDLTIDGAFENIINYFNGSGQLATTIRLFAKRIDLKDLGTSTKKERKDDVRRYVLPPNIHGNVQLDVGELNYDGHQFELISGNMNIQNRAFDFPSIRFRNAGASIVGALKIKETSPEMFQANMALQSSNINLKRVFKAWNNFQQEVIRSEHIYGSTAINLQLSAPFDLRSGVIYKAVQSKIDLKISNGKLQNVEAFDAIAKSLHSPAAKLAIGSKNIDNLKRKLKKLEFETLENTLLIEKGIITVPQMNINSSLVDISTYGTHNFKNEVDYHFSFRLRDLKAEQESKFGTTIDDGTGMMIFMHMFGNISNPTIEWDKTAKKEQRKAYNEQEKKNLKGMLKSELGFYKKDTTVQEYQAKEKPPSETIEVEYGEDTTSVENFVEKKKKRKGKLGKWLNKLEKEQQESSKIEVEIDQ